MLRLQWVALAGGVDPHGDWKRVDIAHFGAAQYLVNRLPRHVPLRLAFSMIGDLDGYSRTDNSLTIVLTDPRGNVVNRHEELLRQYVFDEGRMPVMGLPFVSCAVGAFNLTMEGVHRIDLSLNDDTKAALFEVVVDPSLDEDMIGGAHPAPALEWGGRLPSRSSRTPESAVECGLARWQ